MQSQFFRQEHYDTFNDLEWDFLTTQLSTRFLGEVCTRLDPSLFKNQTRSSFDVSSVTVKLCCRALNIYQRLCSMHTVHLEPHPDMYKLCFAMQIGNLDAYSIEYHHKTLSNMFTSCAMFLESVANIVHNPTVSHNNTTSLACRFVTTHQPANRLVPILERNGKVLDSIVKKLKKAGVRVYGVAANAEKSAYVIDAIGVETKDHVLNVIGIQYQPRLVYKQVSDYDDYVE